VLKVGPLSRPVVTSYKLLIVTISVPFSQCSDLSQTDGQTDDGIGLAKGGTMHSPPKMGQRLKRRVRAVAPQHIRS